MWKTAEVKYEAITHDLHERNQDNILAAKYVLFEDCSLESLAARDGEDGSSCHHVAGSILGKYCPKE